MIRARALAPAVFVLSLATVTPAFAQVFFSMNYNSGAAPTAGWPGGAVPTTQTHTRTFVAGGGPQGEGAYDLTQLYAPTAQGYGGEFYWGWNGNLEAQDPAQGSRRYYRWRMRFSPTTNFRGLYWQDGSRTTLTNKILMVGDGCGRSRCRVIVSYRGADNGRQAQFLRVALDGGDDPADSGPINVGEWVDIQIELDSSSTSSSTDGAYKIWINNNDYSRPTAQRTGIVLNPVNWRYVFFGAYENNGLASDGVHSFRHTGFQASTAFDAAWSRNATLPSAPNNLRIVTPN